MPATQVGGTLHDLAGLVYWLLGVVIGMDQVKGQDRRTDIGIQAIAVGVGASTQHPQNWFRNPRQQPPGAGGELAEQRLLEELGVSRRGAVGVVGGISAVSGDCHA